MCGLADAAGEIGSHGEGHDARRDERRGTATRAARTAIGGQRVIGPPPDGVVGLVEIHRLRNVVLADDQRPGRLQPFDERGGTGVTTLAATLDAEGREHAADRKALLHAHRNSGKHGR